MVDHDQVLKALSFVKLPASGISLVKSGRLSDIVIDRGKVIFSVSIDPTEAAAMEPVRHAAEEAVKRVPHVSQVLITLTSERAPPSPARRPRQARIEGIGHIVAVASGKGGVGKSTTACNLAVALAALGYRTGLLDADIYGPSVPRLFGLTEKPRLLSGRILEPLTAYGVKVMSIGFLVDAETPMIWRGPMVISAITQMLREVAWGELDFLIVDMPPGTGDAQLTMAQSVPLSGAVIVSTPQDLALIDARRGTAMFQKVEVPILGIVENMAMFVCPACGAASPIFGHGGARDEASRLGVPFLGEMPLDMTIRERSDAGNPVAGEVGGVYARLYRDMAQAIVSGLKNAARQAPRIVLE